MLWWQRLEHKKCLTVDMAFAWALGMGRTSTGRGEKGYSRQRGEQDQGRVGRGW